MPITKHFLSFLIGITLFNFLKDENLLNNKILKKETIVLSLEKNLYESQLDFFYLSSPEYLSKKILELSFEEYHPMNHSEIYLSHNDYVKEKTNRTKIFTNEKKNKKN